MGRAARAEVWCALNSKAGVGALISDTGETPTRRRLSRRRRRDPSGHKLREGGRVVELTLDADVRFVSLLGSSAVTKMWAGTVVKVSSARSWRSPRWRRVRFAHADSPVHDGRCQCRVR